jgi:Uma2 family endonuclease
MVTGTAREIDFSTFPESDGEPMAETAENATQMMDLIAALRGLLRVQGRTQVTVGGNQFLYYNEHNGRDHISPDVYVALDVLPGPRPTWKTWVEGKCPDVVFEITSPSTQDEDLGRKHALYARLGAREYYIYDPQQELAPPFRGYELRAGVLVSMSPLASGGIFSPLLRVELRPIGQFLRVIDPTTGRPRPTIEELDLGYETVQHQLTATEQQLVQEREAWRSMEQQLATARQQLVQEEEARRALEQRIAQAEAALQALLDARQAPGQDTPSPET